MGDMVITVLQTLVCMVFVLLGIDTANKPPITEKARWAHRVIFAILGALLLTLTYLQMKNISAKRAPVAVAVQTPATNAAVPPETEEVMADRAILQQRFEKESATIQSNQFALQQQYQGLLNELATNAALGATMHERIIVTKAKLDQIQSQATDLRNWEEQLRGGLKEARTLTVIRSAKEAGDAQSTKDKVLPYFDQAVRALAVLSEKAALLKGDKSVIEFHGLPQTLSSEARTGRRRQIDAGDIHFQNQPAWDFKINFAEQLAPEYQADLGIECKGGVLHLRSDWDSIDTELEVATGETLRHGGATGEGAKKNISDALDKLLAAELAATDSPK